MTILSMKQKEQYVPTSGDWPIAYEWNFKTFAQLLTGKIGAVVIPNWLNQNECAGIARAAEKVGFPPYENVTPVIGRIGITQFEHANNKPLYFERVAESFAKQKQIFDVSHPNLLNDVFSCFATTMGKVEIAEENGKSYFAGVLRQIRRAYLHFDYAPYDGASWSNHNIINQLAWNIYVQLPSSGGAAVVHNRQWQPRIFDEYKLPTENNGSYGFDMSVVNGCSFSAISPNVGDLVLFNPRNFHEVLESPENSAHRISISSFLGQRHNGDWIAWS